MLQVAHNHSPTKNKFEPRPTQTTLLQRLRPTPKERKMTPDENRSWVYQDLGNKAPDFKIFILELLASEDFRAKDQDAFILSLKFFLDMYHNRNLIKNKPIDFAKLTNTIIDLRDLIKYRITKPKTDLQDYKNILLELSQPWVLAALCGDIDLAQLIMLNMYAPRDYSRPRTYITSLHYYLNFGGLAKAKDFMIKFKDYKAFKVEFKPYHDEIKDKLFAKRLAIQAELDAQDKGKEKEADEVIMPTPPTVTSKVVMQASVGVIIKSLRTSEETVDTTKYQAEKAKVAELRRQIRAIADNFNEPGQSVETVQPLKPTPAVLPLPVGIALDNATILANKRKLDQIKTIMRDTKWQVCGAVFASKTTTAKDIDELMQGNKNDADTLAAINTKLRKALHSNSWFTQLTRYKTTTQKYQELQKIAAPAA